MTATICFEKKKRKLCTWNGEIVSQFLWKRCERVCARSKSKPSALAYAHSGDRLIVSRRTQSSARLEWNRSCFLWFSSRFCFFSRFCEGSRFSCVARLDNDIICSLALRSRGSRYARPLRRCADAPKNEYAISRTDLGIKLPFIALSEKKMRKYSPKGSENLYSSETVNYANFAEKMPRTSEREIKSQLRCSNLLLKVESIFEYWQKRSSSLVISFILCMLLNVQRQITLHDATTSKWYHRSYRDGMKILNLRRTMPQREAK